MHSSTQSLLQLEQEVADLRARLDEAEDALRAIRRGEVDALVIETEHDLRVYTLQDSEHAYRVMVETMNEGAASLMADGTILYCNRRLAEMLGLPLEQVLGATFFDLLGEGQREAFSQLLCQAVKSEVRAELSLPVRGAAALPALLSMKSISIDGDHPAACLVVTGLAEQQRSREELEARVAERTVELAQKNRDLENFASVISHDLQEPLRKVRAFGDLLIEESSEHLTGTEMDYIRRMQDASQRMARMIDGLLTLSRISTHPQAHQRVDLKQVVLEVLSILESNLERTAGKVEVEDLPVIEAEPLLMQQLFQNLIGNALKFHKPGVAPLVKVICQELPGPNHLVSNIRIQVDDNGIGFENELADRLFQPFKRLVNRSEYEGTGIGLAICKRIVERYNGQIGATGVPGSGATFWVILPVKQP